MFGFACDETEELMPLPISEPQTDKRLAEVRKTVHCLICVAMVKAQVTVEYVDDIPVRVDTVVVSTA